MEQYYSIKHVAEKLDVTTRTVIRWIDSGTLKAVKVNGNVRIADREIKKLLKGETE